MGSKGKILITLVLFFIAIALSGGILLLLQVGKTQEPVNNNGTTTEEEPNIIDPNDPNNPKLYKFATITPEDTLKLFDEQSKELVINLEHKEWSDIKWSKDRNFISAIGKDANGTNNLFLYDLSTGRWEQITNYEDNEVEQQIWQTDNNLFYTQGVEPERWVHRFKESARTELFKLIKTNGSIAEISANFNKVLIAPLSEEESWKGFIADGIEDWDLSILIADELPITNITDVLFSTNSEKILLTALDEEDNVKYYKTLWGSDLAIEIQGTEIGYIPVCAINEDVFAGYRIDPDANLLEVINFNIKLEKSVFVAETNIPEGTELEPESVICYDINNLMLKFVPEISAEIEESLAESDLFVQWYTLSSDRKTIEQVIFLEGMKDVDVR